MRVALVVSGTAVMAYAIIGSLLDSAADPIGMAVFLVAVLVAHDAVWMPAVLAAGVLLHRRARVRTAALIAASLTVVAIPLVVTQHYGRTLLLLLAAIAAAALIRRKKSESPAGPGPPPADE